MKITDHGSQITAKQHGHSPFKDFGLWTLDLHRSNYEQTRLSFLCVQ